MAGGEWRAPWCGIRRATARAERASRGRVCIRLPACALTPAALLFNRTASLVARRSSRARAQAIESLFCELCGLLVLATKETARPLLKALGAMTSLPPRAIESVRELVECTAQSDREAADGGEMERLMAAVKAVALSKEARSVGGGEAD